MKSRLINILFALSLILWIVIAIAWYTGHKFVEIGTAWKAPATRAPLSAVRVLFGLPPNAPAMVAFQKSLGVEPRFVFMGTCDFYDWKSLGLSFRFDDNKLAAAFAYAQGADGYTAFTGELPNGLEITDTRRDVEAKLGPPPKSGGGGIIPFWVYYPIIGISVGYTSIDQHDPSNAIHHIVLTKIKSSGM